jgi:spore maturation protein CgeB
VADSVVIVGNEGGTNVGDSLLRAARALRVPATLVNAYDAYAGSAVVRRVNWWIRGRRPSQLRSFSRRVVDVCREVRPKWLLTTGFAPVERQALDDIRTLGVETISYLTDDPWNEGARRRWFLETLTGYDRVCSTRRANIEDLERLGCRSVRYVPFGFDEDLFFPDPPSSAEAAAYATDVFFAGGADADRIPYLAAVLDAHLTLSLYGDYWSRFRETRSASRGHATPDVLRKAIAGAAVCLCLVRRSNRDGHSMRSFEVPAAGGCMLVEDTDEHREFFGPPGEAVMYFQTIAEMVEAARRLVREPETRHRLARSAHDKIAHGGFTYRDRITSLLGLDVLNHAC